MWVSVRVKSVLLDIAAGLGALIVVLAVAAKTNASTDIGEFLAFFALAFLLGGIVRGATPPKPLLLKSALVASGAIAPMLALAVGGQAFTDKKWLIAAALVTIVLGAVGVQSRRFWMRNAWAPSLTLAGISVMMVMLIAWILMPRVLATMAIQRIDKPLEPFSMTAVDGSVVTSGDLQGHVVVLSSWATWCGPCVAEYPRIRELRGRYAGDPRVSLWAVNPGLGDDTVQAMRAFVKNRGWDVPAAFDQGQVARSIGISSVPAVAILDQAGHVRIIHSGYDGGEDLVGNLSKEIRVLLEQ